MTVTLGVAAIKGSYTGEVRLTDLVEPTSLTMHASGAGGPGTIDTAVGVTLTDLADGTTRLDYDADATVGGMVGGVGQRVLSSVARKTAGLFFAAIDDVLTGARAVGRTPVQVGAGTVGAEILPSVAGPQSHPRPGGSGGADRCRGVRRGVHAGRSTGGGSDRAPVELLRIARSGRRKAGRMSEFPPDRRAR